MSLIKTGCLLLAGSTLAGCASVSAFTDLVDVFSSGQTAYVREGGASLRCGTEGDAMRVQYFADLDALRQWQQAHGLTLLKNESGTYRYALIEMGAKPTGGYGVVVSRKAMVDGDRLTLNATLIQPAPDQAGASKPTQPCSLVVLPPGEYTQVEVQDQNGRTIASTLPAS